MGGWVAGEIARLGGGGKVRVMVRSEVRGWVVTHPNPRIPWEVDPLPAFLCSHST